MKSTKNILKNKIFSFLLLMFVFCTPIVTKAASLSLSPATGVYKAGATFTVTLFVNSGGTAVNAADGTISFNPRELTVISASRGSSIFSLWTTEPTFSNSAGTVTFSGGAPAGYSGASGNVLSVTFRTLANGPIKVGVTGASVLAADGRGTNVLTSMSGGTYTVTATESQPAPEVVVEYVPTANTPGTPKISSNTHKEGWSKEKNGVFTWDLPSGVTAVRTSLDDSPSAIPTKVYDSPIKTLTLNDLDEGVSYLHVQFKNAEGWGRVANYKIQVDTQKPESLEIKQAPDVDLSNPNQTLLLVTKDTASGVSKFRIQLDGKEPFEINSTSSETKLELKDLLPGNHTVVVEAFDQAMNSVLSSYSFLITSFEKPKINDFPTEINTKTVPVVKGQTKPNSQVLAKFVGENGETVEGKSVSDADGYFVVVADNKLKVGTYKATVRSIDAFGAQSEISDEMTIIVKEGGYLVIGGFLISFLSVLIPLIALCVLTWITFIYSLEKMSRVRRRVIVESNEVKDMLVREFGHIESVLAEQEELLINSRKVKKLTKYEEALIAEVRVAIHDAKIRLDKEVDDVKAVISK